MPTAIIQPLQHRTRLNIDLSGKGEIHINQLTSVNYKYFTSAIVHIERAIMHTTRGRNYPGGHVRTVLVSCDSRNPKNQTLQRPSTPSVSPFLSFFHARRRKEGRKGTHHGINIIQRPNTSHAHNLPVRKQLIFQPPRR